MSSKTIITIIWYKFSCIYRLREDWHSLCQYLQKEKYAMPWVDLNASVADNEGNWNVKEIKQLCNLLLAL